ncbi:MAG: DUF362 domain-containing protein [Clostridiales bacterium]|nr:DUF362 domain-containing protein [Clostridiales bacterium]
MKTSPVYFTDMRATLAESQPAKLKRLIHTAGLGSLDFEKKFVAIKIHFGEPGNMAFLRPQWARVIVDYVKARGGLPFLTDCNTLYAGKRKHALEHLDVARAHGFTPEAVGCHVLIADGLKGTDEVLVPLNGQYIKEAKIGRALWDADMIISLNHFKGHSETGFGGAIKNLGMGGGSRAGKMEMHAAGKPSVDAKHCRGCGACARGCGLDAIDMIKGKAVIDHARCAGCGRCLALCNFDAIPPLWDESHEILCRKMAEYTLAIVKDRPQFHVSLAIDISPDCDCFGSNDAPILPDVGMFASFDCVAIDRAAADLCNAAPVFSNSALPKSAKGDHFTCLHPTTFWREQISYGEKIGLGNANYELITI